MLIPLSPEILLRAYAAGIFPMAETADDPELFWVDPKRRGIIPLDSFHVPRRLRRVVRQNPFTIRCDTAFEAVMLGCAEAGDKRPNTWINDEILELYTGLFERRAAHSVECWHDGELVGGLYGVSLGAAFFGESMFSRVTDASKVALVHLVELLAAVPSVVYGLWGVFVLIPKLKPAEQWFSDTFSFLPFVGGQVAGPNYFIAGLVLAIMILPIVSAITREVMSTVPPDHKEAALALGATRWEMIRTAILPYSRAGISGAAMLGLGRAIGETIAVTIVIGNAPNIGHSIFSQGYTLAAVIANEFGEAASNPLHRSALIAAGLVLFVLTLFVNLIARFYVLRAERGPRVPRMIAPGMGQ